MSQTIIATLVIILASILPKLGLHVGSTDLTTTIQVVVTVICGLWVWVRRYRKGDVTVFGVIK